jgi:hypothetical protein
MSAIHATATALRPEPTEAPSRHLEIAPSRAQRRARPRLVYAIVTVGGIGVILLAQLLLSIVIADGAYTISGLKVEQRDLGRERDALGEQVGVLSSTQNLTANAEALGMVASGDPIFLDLATGAVSGTPTAEGGSLVGAANMIPNSLLGADTVVDPAALAAAQQATAEAAAAETGGQVTTDTSTVTGQAPAAPSTPAQPSTGGSTGPTAGASPTGSGTGDVPSGQSGTIASPITR